ncbi:MAG TPA: GAF domain-containing protein, partial [Phormidium sp.]
YQISPNNNGKVVAEAVVSGFPTILGMSFPEEVFPLPYHQLYNHGRVGIINNIYSKNIDMAPCLIQFVEQWAVKAKLVVPISVNNKLWGLLIIHHCSAPRVWLSSEVSLLSQLAGQIAIAIQQAELYHEIQCFNNTLERQVYIRTLELQQSLKFEATLKRISDKVRDSLDSNQILQTAVNELAITIKAEACDAALYSPDRLTSTIHYQYVQPGLSTTQGQKIRIQEALEIYEQLQQGFCFAFCQTQTSPIRNHSAILVCPIFDGQLEQPEVIGELWVFKSIDCSFSQMEIHLVQQVANQCAIALRQAKLYEAARFQVEELERLNRLKDDFLSTISHELRTPVSS